jgi:hypothetical protein
MRGDLIPTHGGAETGLLNLTPLLASRVYIAHDFCMQYTLREIPPAVGPELRRRAKAEGKSLNTVAIEALVRGCGLGESPIRQRDLADVAGTWQEDREFDQAIEDQDRIDEQLWR